jgi:hypothetical protein
VDMDRLQAKLKKRRNLFTKLTQEQVDALDRTGAESACTPADSSTAKGFSVRTSAMMVRCSTRCGSVASPSRSYCSKCPSVIGPPSDITSSTRARRSRCVPSP